MNYAARRAIDSAKSTYWKVKHRPSSALGSIPPGSDLHLGCGDQRLAGQLNIDVRATSAVDVIADLNHLEVLPPVRSVISHAFFEHLYRLERGPHLKALCRALMPDGWVLYLGLPDFATIAQLYLEGAEGCVSERFDLFEVYRYTHGDPEHAPTWWLAQLHKSLFDRAELEGLLRDAGFGSWMIGTYAYGQEPHALNLVFYARADSAADAELALDAMAELPVGSVRPGSLRWY